MRRTPQGRPDGPSVGPACKTSDAARVLANSLNCWPAERLSQTLPGALATKTLGDPPVLGHGGNHYIGTNGAT